VDGDVRGQWVLVDEDQEDPVFSSSVNAVPGEHFGAFQSQVAKSSCAICSEVHVLCHGVQQQSRSFKGHCIEK
jgi:hypothetical protein